MPFHRITTKPLINRPPGHIPLAKGGYTGTTGLKLKLSDIPAIVKIFMPEFQQKIIVGSEEHWDILDELKWRIQEMPHTYQTNKIPTNDKIIQLHYFYGQSDWYIVEKDSEKEQLQAYGYVILNGDMQNSEWGYISIEEIKGTNKIELDFYFTPIKFGELKKQWEEEPKGNVTQKKGNSPGNFSYGKNFGVPERYSVELMFFLKQLGFTIISEYYQALVLEKNGHQFFVNDNGGEFNLGENKLDQPHIANISYTGSHPEKWIASPEKSAHRIKEEFNDYYDIQEDLKPVGDNPMDAHEFLYVGHGDNDAFVRFNSKESAEKWVKKLDQRKYYVPIYNTNESEMMPIGWYLVKNDGTESFLQKYRFLEMAQYNSVDDDDDEDLDENEYEHGEKFGNIDKDATDFKEFDLDEPEDPIKKQEHQKDREQEIKDEYKNKRQSLDEFFTPKWVAAIMYRLAKKHGFTGGNVGEPSFGHGVFFDVLTENGISQSQLFGFEIFQSNVDFVRAKYPDAHLVAHNFEYEFAKVDKALNRDGIFKDGAFQDAEIDMFIGNPPYGYHKSPYSYLWDTELQVRIEGFFIYLCLQKLKKGGILVFIINSLWLYNKDKYNRQKERIYELGTLIDAYRLPSNTFKGENRDTSIATDIVVFRKK